MSMPESDSLRMAIVNLYEVDYPSLMQETRRLEGEKDREKGNGMGWGTKGL